MVFYKNQPKVCFKCNKPGHLAKEGSLHSYTERPGKSEQPPKTKKVQETKTTGKVHAEDIQTSQLVIAEENTPANPQTVADGEEDLSETESTSSKRLRSNSSSSPEEEPDSVQPKLNYKTLTDTTEHMDSDNDNEKTPTNTPKKQRKQGKRGHLNGIRPRA